MKEPATERRRYEKGRKLEMGGIILERLQARYFLLVSTQRVI